MSRFPRCFFIANNEESGFENKLGKVVLQIQTFHSALHLSEINIRKATGSRVAPVALRMIRYIETCLCFR